MTSLKTIASGFRGDMKKIYLKAGRKFSTKYLTYYS
jgi:hypothetical protein